MYKEIKDKTITVCPHCGSNKIRKAGRLANGYQRYHCRECNKKVSVLTTEKYYHTSEVECPYCKSKRNRLAGRLKDGTIRRTCNNCGRGFSEKTVIRPEITETCPYCKSKNIRREGTTNGVQRYLCKDCKHVFTPLSLKNIKSKETIKTLYCEGTSIQQLSQQFNLTERTIYNYIKGCSYREHIIKATEKVDNKTRKYIVYYGLGAGVGIKDLSHYFNVPQDVVERILKNYKEKYKD